MSTTLALIEATARQLPNSSGPLNMLVDRYFAEFLVFSGVVITAYFGLRNVKRASSPDFAQQTLAALGKTAEFAAQVQSANEQLAQLRAQLAENERRLVEVRTILERLIKALERVDDLPREVMDVVALLPQTDATSRRSLPS